MAELIRIIRSEKDELMERHPYNITDKVRHEYTKLEKKEQLISKHIEGQTKRSDIEQRSDVKQRQPHNTVSNIDIMRRVEDLLYQTNLSINHMQRQNQHENQQLQDAVQYLTDHIEDIEHISRSPSQCSQKQPLKAPQPKRPIKLAKYQPISGRRY